MLDKIKRYHDAFQTQAKVLPLPQPAPLPSPKKLAQYSPQEAEEIVSKWETAWRDKMEYDREAFKTALIRIRLCTFLTVLGCAYSVRDPHKHFSWCPRKEWFQSPTLFEGHKPMPDFDYM